MIAKAYFHTNILSIYIRSVQSEAEIRTICRVFYECPLTSALSAPPDIGPTNWASCRIIYEPTIQQSVKPMCQRLMMTAGGTNGPG